MQPIPENIRVAVIFGPGNAIRPVWFDWHRRKYAVEEITYSWRERNGAATILHFAVTCGADLFELAYDTGGQTWALTAMPGEAGAGSHLRR